jgi:hypothetical protein
MQYEYKILPLKANQFGDNPLTLDALNKEGKEGWEAFHVHMPQNAVGMGRPYFVFLRRPMDLPRMEVKTVEGKEEEVPVRQGPGRPKKK